MPTGFTVAVGFTVMVNTMFVPVHPFAVGVTVIVATVGAVPALVAVNNGIFPVPLAARPTVGLLFVQTKVVPATGLPIVTTEVVAPLQNAIFPIGFTTGVGYNVIVNVDGVPMQPFADGVMVIVAITVEKPGFVAVKEGMDPVPLAARPMDGVLFVQVKDVPATGLVILIAAVAAPLQ